MISGVHNTVQPYMPIFSGSGTGVPNSAALSALHSSPAKTINSVDKPTQTLEHQASERIPDIASSRTPNSSIEPSSSNSISTAEQNAAQVAQAESSQQQATAEQQIQQVVNQLKARDAEVRAHEQAHMAAAGSYATGMSFTYQTGPDGRQYAIGGEVGIDSSAIPGDPEATLQKAQIIQQAALAPAEPSAQDHRVARAAGQMMAEARAEIAAQSLEEAVGGSEEPTSIDSREASQQTSVSQNAVNSIAENRDAEQSGLNLIEQARQQFNVRLQVPVAENLFT